MHLIPLLCIALSPIQIDGSFHDWAKGVTSQEDEHFVYKLVLLPERACWQQLPEQKVVELGEYTILFSPKGKGYGVSCKQGDNWISPYEAGIVFAPATASTKFELRANKPKIKSPVRPFSLTPTGNLRVVSWNVHFGNLLKDKERGARILKALQPDVLLIQELDGDDTAEILEKFLRDTLDSEWSVGVSPVSGTKKHHRLHSAIATRLNPKKSPIRPLTFSNDTPLKVVIAGVDTEDGPITFVSLHLRCCGGPLGEAEEQRQEEANRIKSLLENVQAPRFIIAGDWNLVGTTAPLEIVQDGKLAIVDAYQPDGVLNATWSDVTSSFTPGRLDWMLYSPSFFEVVTCFVLDTADLQSETLRANDLLSEDTAELSDHLPLVADFKVIK
jgi:endonuclease/exonuclease/phosphatase family metal-dependent hydrolase